MRGVYCDGISVRLRDDLPVPEAGDGEVVLNVRAVGICDTDLQLARGYMGFRGVLGHEFVGQTASGRRVTAEINNACHRCPTCLAGRPQHCPNRTVLGILRHDGAMADVVRVPERNLHDVPDALEDREAVFIEPLAAAFRITEQLELGPDVRMAVLGDGKLGTPLRLGRATDRRRGQLDRQAPRQARAGGRRDRDASRSTRPPALGRALRRGGRLHRVADRAARGARAGPALRDGGARRPRSRGLTRSTWPRS